MQSNDLRKLIGTSILALSLLATGAGAQTTPAQGDAQTTTDTDDGGMDLGWLGLLGLAGLLGLRKKEEHHVTRVDTTAGTGSPRARV